MDLVTVIWSTALLTLTAALGHRIGGPQLAVEAAAGAALIYGVVVDLTDRS